MFTKIVERVIAVFVLYAVLSALAVWTIGTAGPDIGLAVLLIAPLMLTAGLIVVVPAASTG